MPNPGNLGYHDVGGVAAVQLPSGRVASPTDPREEYPPWERRIHAMRLVLGKRGLISSDELRRAIEQLEANDAQPLRYYEKWLFGVTAILVERGVVTRREIDAALDGDAQHTAASLFAPGDIVRVREEGATRRWRKPHLRVPGYLHGCTGVVTAMRGRFPDPEYAAFRELFAPSEAATATAPRTAVLYTVRFRACDVFGAVGQETSGGADPLNYDIHADIFHDWLSRASALEPQRHHFLPQPAHSHNHGEHHDHADHHHHHEHQPRCKVEEIAKAKEPPPRASQLFAEALEALLVSKGVLTRAQLIAELQALDAIGERLLGPRIVARAWVDDNFRRALLADAEAAVMAAFGVSTSNYNDAKMSLDGRRGDARSAAAATELTTYKQGHTVLRVVENTRGGVHNIVVCTLCSCYPASILGLSPDWYKSSAYRAQIVRDPRGTLRSLFGLELPPAVATKVVVHDSTAELRYLVLPLRPAGTEGWSEEQLAKLVTRDSMLGVAVIDDVKPQAKL